MMIKQHVIYPVVFLLFLGLLGCKGNESENEESLPEEFNNPLDVAFGDPFILDDGNGKFYMYGTGAGAKDGFVVYGSEDLKNWDHLGQVFYGNTDDTWSIANFWAPEVYKFDRRYYMFYSADWRVNPENDLENFRIGVAVADSPKGPFVDLKDEPLFDPGYPIIDANVFKDDDGKFYLYYSRACYKHPVDSEIAVWAKEEGLFEEIEESWVYGVELKPDFSGVTGEPVLLLRPPVSMNDQQAEWESRSVSSGEVNRRWTEGSFTFKHGRTYYIMYSANHFGGEHYAVGYATGNSPLGPFEKASNNPVIEKNTETGGVVTGTGHNSVLFSSDGKEMYAVYHGRTQKTGQERLVFIDRMSIDENGKLEVHGPTTSEK
ncbi:Endo-1,4-beta-xylanase D [Indibacter alkaliphilus LW1]|uniref:Endo-1,4-beta-xylanase D n=1 Tax=Indibacter alkaliphilus (strain CCUG 57479 / KCTC 22604 / LW1) TaxID=1189612 RepID=S2DNU9_INDAL|nr:glycoside hydrolase family 43 protein [Indibacter alkaliphilus]EOZ91498.1 Endo-1,4-beta-xylanase D [Indibacter alkaliphilus LW1]